MNKVLPQRLLPIGGLRTFEAVARHLSFRAAAEELHLTQPAVSRQIQALETDVGAALLVRGTRHVALTPAGGVLLRAIEPALAQIDSAVRQVRYAEGRRAVNLSTFATFASLWLIPRLGQFQHRHPDIDIRIATTDSLANLTDGSCDIALRKCPPERAQKGAVRLCDDVLTPVISPWYAARVASGELPPLAVPRDLAGHTLLEEDDAHPANVLESWHHWLASQGLADLEPRRWVYFNFIHQQVQAALAGQGVALAQPELVADQLASGDLIEPFGAAGRLATPNAYWLMVSPATGHLENVRLLAEWIAERGAETRHMAARAGSGTA